MLYAPTLSDIDIKCDTVRSEHKIIRNIKKGPRTEANICGSHLRSLLTAIDIRTKNNGPQNIFMKAVDRLHRFTDGFNFLHIS